MSGLESDQIRYAIQVARAKGYRQVRIGVGEDRFSAVLASQPAAFDESIESSEPAESVEPAVRELSVTAPSVGYFRAVSAVPTPGDKVEPGDKVGEIIALGLANDVTSKERGTVVEVCVVDGQAVEFGQPLILLRQ